MSVGLYSGTSGLALGTGLYKGVSGLWGGASGLIDGFGASLYLDFLAGAPLDSRVTFTRASTATFVGSNGLIQTAAINAPRFDYDPSTLAPKGLLIEEQRANLIVQSEGFDTASWNKINATVTNNASVSPTGASTADAMVENTTNGSHGVQQFVSYTSGLSYTISCYVKAGTRSWVRVTFPNAAFTGSPGSFYNLSGAGALGTASGSPTARSITAVGNGWYRITLTATATATAGGNTIILAAVADNNSFYAGVAGAEALYLWGAQLEAGAFVTSYIPTIAATVTRSADITSMTGTNFSSWYNQSEGTFVSEFSFFASNDTVSSKAFFAVSDGTTNNRIYGNLNSLSVPFVFIAASGATQANMSTVSAVTNNIVAKVATAYKANDFAAVLNAATVTTDTSGTVPTVNLLGIANLNNFSQLNGHIRQIAYYNTRLPNDTLQALTA